MSLPIPFPKCWWVDDRLLAGPAFCASSRLETSEKLDALAAVGVGSIVGLAPIGEFISDEDEAEAMMWDLVMWRFGYHAFAIPDGTAPDPITMDVILTWMGCGGGKKVFVHCGSGRGRTGTAVGCWLARHGHARGAAVLDRIAELRRAAGLTGDCPETDVQRALVTSWRKGQ